MKIKLGKIVLIISMIVSQLYFSNYCNSYELDAGDTSGSIPVSQGISLEDFDISLSLCSGPEIYADYGSEEDDLEVFRSADIVSGSNPVVSIPTGGVSFVYLLPRVENIGNTDAAYADLAERLEDEQLFVKIEGELYEIINTLTDNPIFTYFNVPEMQSIIDNLILEVSPQELKNERGFWGSVLYYMYATLRLPAAVVSTVPASVVYAAGGISKIYLRPVSSSPVVADAEMNLTEAEFRRLWDGNIYSYPVLSGWEVVDDAEVAIEKVGENILMVKNYSGTDTLVSLDIERDSGGSISVLSAAMDEGSISSIRFILPGWNGIEVESDASSLTATDISSGQSVVFSKDEDIYKEYFLFPATGGSERGYIRQVGDKWLTFDSNYILSGIYNYDDDTSDGTLLQQDFQFLGNAITITTEVTSDDSPISPAVVRDFLTSFFAYKKENNEGEFTRFLFTGLDIVNVVDDTGGDSMYRPFQHNQESITIPKNLIDNWLAIKGGTGYDELYLTLSIWLTTRMFVDSYDSVERESVILFDIPPIDGSGHSLFNSYLSLFDKRYDLFMRDFPDMMGVWLQLMDDAEAYSLITLNDDAMGATWNSPLCVDYVGAILSEIREDPQYGFLSPNVLLDAVGTVKPDNAIIPDIVSYMMLTREDSFIDPAISNALIDIIHPLDGNYDELHEDGYDVRYLLKFMLLYDLGQTVLNIAEEEDGSSVDIDTSPQRFLDWFETNVIGVDEIGTYFLEEFRILAEIYPALKALKYNLENGTHGALEIADDSIISAFIERYKWVENFPASIRYNTVDHATFYEHTPGSDEYWENMSSLWETTFDAYNDVLNQRLDVGPEYPGPAVLDYFVMTSSSYRYNPSYLGEPYGLYIGDHYTPIYLDLGTDGNGNLHVWEYLFSFGDSQFDLVSFAASGMPGDAGPDYSRVQVDPIGNTATVIFYDFYQVASPIKTTITYRVSSWDSRTIDVECAEDDNITKITFWMPTVYEIENIKMEDLINVD
ncbi:MAG: hypothetical protein P9M06_05690 [Candidatus Saelkia tenebricola]|nr:hypothetical protein [Candidatus Saelkia tenebricola]